MNISRQGVRGNPNRLIPASALLASDPRYIEIRASADFPMADEAWNKPIANGLAWSGWFPREASHGREYAAHPQSGEKPIEIESQTVVENALNPVKIA